MIQKLKISTFLCFIFISVSISPVRATDVFTVPDEFIERAQKVLPLRNSPYEVKQIQQIFCPILLLKTEEYFNKYLLIMSVPDFPTFSYHSNEKIIAWQSLYAKMAHALTIDDCQESQRVQVDALAQFVILHKKEEFESIFAEKTPDHPPKGRNAGRKSKFVRSRYPTKSDG